MKNTIAPEKDFKALENRRLAAVRMFRKGLTQSEISQIMKVSRQAVHVWHKKFKKRGEESLLSHKATGRPPKVSGTVIKKQLPGILARGAATYGFTADIWTTANISLVMRKECGIEYHRDHMRKILHSLGFSWQKPEKRAIERNERRIKYWVNTTWPDIKKKH